MQVMAYLFIGTSGWSYDHWEEVFYPSGLAKKDRLSFYAGQFSTVEINASFYRLPTTETFAKWRAQTPDDFLFSVKASRYLTHVKKLRDVRDSWERFYERAAELREKLGPILFQTPPNWRFNLERLEEFLAVLPDAVDFTCEFRDPSWFNRRTYDALRRRGVALCQADSPGHPATPVLTADFVFIRMHGGRQIYASKYSSAELKQLADKIKTYLHDRLSVFVYFNNDALGHAVDNARELRKLLKPG